MILPVTLLYWFSLIIIKKSHQPSPNSDNKNVMGQTMMFSQIKAILKIPEEISTEANILFTQKQHNTWILFLDREVNIYV